MVGYVSEHASVALPADTSQNSSADTPANERSRPRRRRRKPGENRERLLAAGLIEFGARGLRGTATSHIAERADVPQPHIYSSFSTKQELFLACLSRAVDALTVSSLAPRCGAPPEVVLPVNQQVPDDLAGYSVPVSHSRILTARMVFQGLAAVGEGGSLGEAIMGELTRLRSALTDSDFDQLILVASKSYLSPHEDNTA